MEKAKEAEKIAKGLGGKTLFVAATAYDTAFRIAAEGITGDRKKEMLMRHIAEEMMGRRMRPDEGIVWTETDDDFHIRLVSDDEGAVADVAWFFPEGGASGEFPGKGPVDRIFSAVTDVKSKYRELAWERGSADGLKFREQPEIGQADLDTSVLCGFAEYLTVLVLKRELRGNETVMVDGDVVDVTDVPDNMALCTLKKETVPEGFYAQRVDISPLLVTISIELLNEALYGKGGSGNRAAR